MVDLSACEYWLLDTALNRYISTADLLSDNYGGINIYPFVPIFTKEEIIDSFVKLFTQGYLLATQKHGEKIFTPNIQEIQEVFSQSSYCERSFFYLLTDEGGKKWESLSSPDWNAYTIFYQAGGTEKPDVFTGDILGVKLSWIEKRLSSFLTSPISPNGVNLLPKIIKKKYSNVIPYEATYWKTFQKGYWLSFEYKFSEQSAIDRDVLISYEKDKIENIEELGETYWYTHPYGQFRSQAKQALKT